MEQKVQNGNGICFLTLKKNTEIKLRFGIPACRQISELILTDVEGVYFSNNAFTELGIAKLLYYGYWNECIVLQIKQLYTIEDFVEYVEDKALSGDLDQIKTASQTWAESKVTAKMLADVKPGKKKADPKKK